jgi:hypothetical protein
MDRKLAHAALPRPLFLACDEPRHLAELVVARALDESEADIERTFTLFEDAMTMTIDRARSDSWNVVCRRIPVPRPGTKSNWIPVFSFSIGRRVLTSAHAQLLDVGRKLEAPPRSIVLN